MRSAYRSIPNRPLPWLASLALVVWGAAVAPLGGPVAGDDPTRLVTREVLALVEREMLRDLVLEHRRAAPLASREHVVQVIQQEASSAGVDPLLVAAIVARESSFRSHAVSSAGAVGLMQLRPFVARDVALRTNLSWREGETLQRPRANVRLGVAYYLELVERFDGDVRLALAAYHRGPTRVAGELRRGEFTGSRYAGRVLELYRELDARRRGRLGVAS
jgi:soluble lytic murein transglycosylase-like protein